MLFDWIEEHDWTGFKRVLNRGAHGNLRSVSTVSAVAWTSHLTGLEPETHGVDSFVSDEEEWIKTWHINHLTYPEYLDQSGIEVLMMNYINIWPPLELKNGTCVAGSATPVGVDDYFYPDSIEKYLQNYRIDFQFGDRPYGALDDDLEVDKQTIRNEIKDVLQKRLDTCLTLMEEREWELTSLLIEATDSIQHLFWLDMLQEDPEHGDAIFEVYSMLDEFLSEVLTRYPDSDIVLLSDHGFQLRQHFAEDSARGRVGKTLDYAARNFVPKWVKSSSLSDRLITDLYYPITDRLSSAPSEGTFSTGMHKWNGIWIGGGPSFESGLNRDVGFLDLCPLIVHLAGQPVPSAYEGTFPDGILSGSPEVTYEDIDLETKRDRPRLTAEEEEAIEDQLAGLGYVELARESE